MSRPAAASLALALSSAATAQNAIQWRVQDGGNGHWYQRVSSPLSWPAAKSASESMGGHLATITSQGEQGFLAAIGAPEYWLGASAPTNQGCGSSAWAWVTGEQMSYYGWAPGEPGTCSHTCMAFAIWGGYDGRWNNDLCSRPDAPGYMVEWSADCNGDGIVDFGQCRVGSLPDYDGNNVPDCCESGVPCVAGTYPLQWRVQDGGNGHWYTTSSETGSWVLMQELAMSRGGSLASLASEAENDFANRTRRAVDAPLGGGPWIGARKLPGQPWSWPDGVAWGFTNWAPGEPCCGDAGLYVHLVPTGQWQDHNQTEYPCRALIEWSADCNGDGIVDYGQILQGQLADANADGVPDECQSPACGDADLYADGQVDATDLSLILSNWGESKLGDVNRDGTVDAADLAAVLFFWGPCP